MKLAHCRQLFEPFAAGDLYVGFSGGADSTAALLVALDFQPEISYRLTAVHFNHHLRGDASDREAELATEFAARHGILFRRYDLELPAGPNLEARARVARLAVWRELVGGREDAAVVLGHHADDTMETLLLRLTRGGNVSGLTGLHPRATVSGVRLLRPLLPFTRAEIEDFLRSRGIDAWAEDASNADNSFARNRIRHEIVPALRRLHPGAAAGLRHSLDALTVDAAYLEQRARQLYRRLPPGEAVPVAFWRKLPSALLIRVLRRYLSDAMGREFVPGQSFLKRFGRALREERPGLLPIDGRCFLELRHGTTQLVTPKRQDLAIEMEWEWRKTSQLTFNQYFLSVKTHPAGVLKEPGKVPLQQAIFDADHLPEKILTGPRRDGDQIIPFGRKNAASLKKLRIDRGLPAHDATPVLRAPDGTILWAPGIRHSAHAAVTEATRQVAVFTIEPRPEQE